MKKLILLLALLFLPAANALISLHGIYMISFVQEDLWNWNIIVEYKDGRSSAILHYDNVKDFNADKALIIKKEL